MIVNGNAGRARPSARVWAVIAGMHMCYKGAGNYSF